MPSKSRETISIAVIGAGVMGREHAARLDQNPRSRSAAVVDPSPAAAAWAGERSLRHHESLDGMLSVCRPRGAIVATPTQDHAATAIRLLEAGIPVLVEKPLAGDLAEAAKLVRAAGHCGVPLLAGYHRRHSLIIQAAQAYAASGHLGRIVAVAGTTLFHKPDGYFEAGWRTGAGGGPILINLAHDIDSLRALVGEITAVQAAASNCVRGFAVEDTAAVLLEFENGAVGTLVLSDCTVAPRSWEQTAGENPLYARDDSQDCLFLAGTGGSLAAPSLRWWQQDGERSWALPFLSGRIEVQPADPLARQLDHFLDVVEGRAQPLVTAAEAFRSLAATLAVRDAAASGRRVVPVDSAEFF
jgi:predicted dehydrogenase